MTQTHLPDLSDERLEQMIHLATSHEQVAVRVHSSHPFVQQLGTFFHFLSRPYPLGAIAATATCLIAFWLVLTPAPDMTVTPTGSKTYSAGISDYIMQDFLDEVV